jgi:hypothetical protein
MLVQEFRQAKVLEHLLRCDEQKRQDLEVQPLLQVNPNGNVVQKDHVVLSEELRADDAQEPSHPLQQ